MCSLCTQTGHVASNFKATGCWKKKQRRSEGRLYTTEFVRKDKTVKFDFVISFSKL